VILLELIDEALPSGIIPVCAPVNHPAPLLETVAFVEIANLIRFGGVGLIAEALALGPEQAH
jgi:hypothetical protein